MFCIKTITERRERCECDSTDTALFTNRAIVSKAIFLCIFTCFLFLCACAKCIDVSVTVHLPSGEIKILNKFIVILMRINNDDYSCC